MKLQYNKNAKQFWITISKLIIKHIKLKKGDDFYMFVNSQGNIEMQKLRKGGV